MQPNNGLIRIDFEQGSADLTPAEVTALLSDEIIRGELRRAVLRLRGQVTRGADPKTEAIAETLRSL